MYESEEFAKNPLVILNVVASTTQGEPVPDDIAVVVSDPPPVFRTQLGNGVHEPLPKHVTFKLPPVLV